MPYTKSVMTFFEMYRMNIPLFAPSLALLLSWEQVAAAVAVVTTVVAGTVAAAALPSVATAAEAAAAVAAAAAAAVVMVAIYACHPRLHSLLCCLPPLAALLHHG